MDLNSQKKVVLTESCINTFNNNRKRLFQPEQWRDNVAKLNRNSGQPYIPRSKIPKPGVLGPSQEKECWDECLLNGCRIGLENRMLIFQSYWDMKDYNTQRTFLATLIEFENLNGRNLYRYFFQTNGSRMEVCRETFMKTFAIKHGTLQYLKAKLLNGHTFIKDQRGLAPNLYKTPDEIKTLMTAHIDRFPKYPVHYSRRKYGEFYLNPALTLTRMFRLFADENFGLEGIGLKENLYRSMFRKSGLTIGQPKSDTCKMCDKLNIDLIAANNNQERMAAEAALFSHHIASDNAYLKLNEDLERARRDETYIVLCGDLQQVLFCPSLSHSDVFYKRQLSTYNYCLYDGATQNGTMAVWDESIGRRGVDEVASCLVTKVLNSFAPLEEGQNRTLIFWSDRCRGQVNNWQMICTLIYLIEQRFFSNVEQKFLLTGHTFLPCDRLFALIEKRRRTAKVMVPEEWIPVLEETRLDNPFIIQRMTQENIMDFKALERFIPRPQHLHVTDIAWLCISSENPHTLLTRPDHNASVWNMHRIFAPNQHGRIRNRRNWSTLEIAQFQLNTKYNEPIPISAEKKADLISFLDFMLPEYRDFYRNLRVLDPQ